MAVELLLNISLLFSLLIAPSIYVLSFWYRRSMGRAIFEWHRQEMVFFTIVFSAVALIFLIIGISCIFTHWGYLDAGPLAHSLRDKFFQLSLSCFLGIFGLTLTYLSLRRILVQVVQDKGVIFTQTRLMIPVKNTLLEWDQIADYYIIPDYPNTIFTFIVQSEDMKFERFQLRVPIYLRDVFQSRLDNELSEQQLMRPDTQRSDRFFSEEEN